MAACRGRRSTAERAEVKPYRKKKCRERKRKKEKVSSAGGLGGLGSGCFDLSDSKENLDW